MDKDIVDPGNLADRIFLIDDILKEIKENKPSIELTYKLLKFISNIKITSEMQYSQILSILSEAHLLWKNLIESYLTFNEEERDEILTLTNFLEENKRRVVPEGSNMKPSETTSPTKNILDFFKIFLLVTGMDLKSIENLLTLLPTLNES